MKDKDKTMKKSEVNLRQLESELKRSKKMFTALLDSLEAVVYVTDIETYELLYINKYSRDIFGDIAGKLCWQTLQTGQTGPCAFCTNDKLVTSQGRPKKGVYRWEFQNTVNGRWYDIHDKAIEWIDGRIARLEIATDITERKETEEALRVSEEKYRDLFENAGDPIFIVDNNYNYVDANRKASEMLGYSKEELLKTNIFKLIPPDQAERSKNTLKQLHSEGTYKDFTGKIRTKDGRWLDIEVSSTAIKRDGVVVGSRDIIRDVTERKRREKELVIASEEWQQTFDSIPDIVVVINNNYEIVKANKALSKILGLPNEAIVGKYCYDVIHGKSEAPSYCLHNKAALDKKEHTAEQYEEKLKGYYLMSATPILDQKGDFLGVVQIARNISEHKVMEEKLRIMSLTDDLTGIYNRRGFFALAEQQLKQSIRDKKGIYLVVVDVDHLKFINDTFGHQEGDVVLIRTANFLKESFRESDIIARIGGDEFIVLVNETPGANTDTITIRLKEHVKAYNRSKSKHYEISISMGVMYCDPKEPCNLERMIFKADKLMYEQKKKKRESE